MNRNDFQQLAELRLNESKALLAAGFPEGAYYLAGYAIECALKACIAKRTREHDFPDKKLANDIHTHNLKELLRLAELNIELNTVIAADTGMASALDKIQDWSETTGYQRKTAQDAADLLKAVEDQPGGLLPWIRLHW